MESDARSQCSLACDCELAMKMTIPLMLTLCVSLALSGCREKRQDGEEAGTDLKGAGLAAEDPCASGIVTFMQSPDVREWAQAQYGSWRSGSVMQPEEMAAIHSCEGLAVGSLVACLLADSVGSLKAATCHVLTEITGRRFGDCAGFLRDNPSATTVHVTAQDWQKWWASNSQKTRLQWLEDAVSDTNCETRAYAAAQLGALGDKHAVRALRNALTASRGNLQYQLTESLAELGDSSAIPYLVELYLTHETDIFRKQGIRLLMKLTGQDMGYAPEASLAKRKAAIQRWKQWLKQHT